ncbi:hypothetical protein MMC32_000479 [Xylographa parallela]|nr:hypothetical protein [Xylographa parallela]
MPSLRPLRPLHLLKPTMSPPIRRPISSTPILVPHTPIAELEPLLTANGGKWTLSADGKGLERSVKFGTFRRTRVYNRAFIRLTTHRDKDSGESGISAKDLDFARFCDGAIGDDDVSAGAAADSSWGTELTSRISEAAHVPEMAESEEEGKEDSREALGVLHSGQEKPPSSRISETAVPTSPANSIPIAKQSKNKDFTDPFPGKETGKPSLTFLAMQMENLTDGNSKAPVE